MESSGQINVDDIYSANKKMCSAINVASEAAEEENEDRKRPMTWKQHINFIAEFLFPFNRKATRKNVWYTTEIPNVERMYPGTWIYREGDHTVAPDIILRICEEEIYIISFSFKERETLDDQVNSAAKAYGLPTYGFRYDILNSAKLLESRKSQILD